ncbi:4941_t:CDS:2, partial [Paraglomus brasilianum]
MPKDKGKAPASSMPYSLRKIKTSKRANAKPDETSATPGPVTLYCLVRVKIKKDATVGEFKDAIKAVKLNDFAKFDADTIVLRKVNIPTTEKTAFEAVKNAEADIETDLGVVTIEDVASVIADEYSVTCLPRNIFMSLLSSRK